MKYFFKIIATVALLNSVLVAAEVNKPTEEIKSKETKIAQFQTANDIDVEADTRAKSEKTVESRDWVITAFTFLLAALTVMATLFGIFIGYMGWKSGKEYERELARAEQAAERAEEAAKEADATVHEIRKKGQKTISDLEDKFTRTAQDISRTIKPEEGAPSEIKSKIVQLIIKIERMYEDRNYEGSINLVEAALLFDENNAQLWHLFAIVLSTKRRFQEALKKVDTAISKDPNQGFFYDSRSFIKLCWWRGFKGPRPSKSEVIKDIKKATELGFEIEQSTKEELSYFLRDDEYKELLGTTKEEDGFGR